MPTPAPPPTTCLLQSRRGRPSPRAGQVRVPADTGVTIKPKINRLDNNYMLLVPINLIAVFLPPFTRQENAAVVASSQGGTPCPSGHQPAVPTHVIPSNSAPDDVGGSPSSRAIKKGLERAPCCKIYAGLR